MINDVVLVADIEHTVMACACADGWIAAEDQFGGSAERAEWAVAFDIFDSVGRISPSMF